jgi:hypothetical protein
MTVTQEMKPLDMNDGDYAIWLATPGNASIGGNDVAAICGLNPWAKPADTYDRIMRMDTRRVNSAMQRGIMLEPIVAHLYEEQTGRMLQSASQHRPRDLRAGQPTPTGDQGAGRSGVLQAGDGGHPCLLLASGSALRLRVGIKFVGVCITQRRAMGVVDEGREVRRQSVHGSVDQGRGVLA